jgi:hypothetical protein
VLRVTDWDSEGEEVEDAEHVSDGENVEDGTWEADDKSGLDDDIGDSDGTSERLELAKWETVNEFEDKEEAENDVKGERVGDSEPENELKTEDISLQVAD